MSRFQEKRHYDEVKIGLKMSLELACDELIKHETTSSLTDEQRTEYRDAMVKKFLESGSNLAIAYIREQRELDARRKQLTSLWNCYNKTAEKGKGSD